MTRITKVQRAALMKFMNSSNQWLLLPSFAGNTIKSLIDRGMIEANDGAYCYRITPSGREALGLVPCPPV